MPYVSFEPTLQAVLACDYAGVCPWRRFKCSGSLVKQRRRKGMMRGRWTRREWVTVTFASVIQAKLRARWQGCPVRVPELVQSVEVVLLIAVFRTIVIKAGYPGARVACDGVQWSKGWRRDADSCAAVVTLNCGDGAAFADQTLQTNELQKASCPGAERGLFNQPCQGSFVQVQQFNRMVAHRRSVLRKACLGAALPKLG